jgi:hypothetical protein
MLYTEVDYVYLPFSFWKQPVNTQYKVVFTRKVKLLVFSWGRHLKIYFISLFSAGCED